jgi:hypothetical protein
MILELGLLAIRKYLGRSLGVSAAYLCRKIPELFRYRCLFELFWIKILDLLSIRKLNQLLFLSYERTIQNYHFHFR